MATNGTTYVLIPESLLRAVVIPRLEGVCRRWASSPSPGMREESAAVEQELVEIECALATYAVRARLWGPAGVPRAPELEKVVEPAVVEAKAP